MGQCNLFLLTKCSPEMRWLKADPAPFSEGYMCSIKWKNRKPWHERILVLEWPITNWDLLRNKMLMTELMTFWGMLISAVFIIYLNWFSFSLVTIEIEFEWPSHSFGDLYRIYLKKTFFKKMNIWLSQLRLTVNAYWACVCLKRSTYNFDVHVWLRIIP